MLATFKDRKAILPRKARAFTSGSSKTSLWAICLFPEESEKGKLDPILESNTLCYYQITFSAK